MAAVIQAIVFDCFGVLYEDAFKEFIERYVAADAHVPRSHYYELALQADRGFIQDETFYSELSTLSGLSPATIRRRLRRLSVLNEAVVKIIVELKPRYRIGMLSNAEREFLDRFLRNHDLAGHFDVTLASSETAFVKPQEPIFAEMAGRLQVPYAHLLFVDDSATNTATAQSYGIPSITYESPEQLRAELGHYLT